MTSIPVATERHVHSFITDSSPGQEVEQVAGKETGILKLYINYVLGLFIRCVIIAE
jgi:hypothetical protein